jgi:hypothetical protein
MRLTLAEEVKLLAAVDCLKTLIEEELEELAKKHPDAYFEPGRSSPRPGRKTSDSSSSRRGGYGSTGCGKAERRRLPT